MREDIEIDELISRFLAGEASPGEAIQLEDWKTASTVNKTYFDSAAKIFVSDKIDETKTRQEAWMKIKAEINKAENSGKSITLKWWKPGIAASLIILIGIAVLFKYFNTKSPEAPEILIYKATSVAKKILLKDGSDIVIATNSEIKLDKGFGKTNRNISLAGSAFFSVKHNSLLPFVINMQQLHVKDVGTKFHINSKTDTVFVTMEEGEVLLYDDFGARQNLVAGNKASYAKSTRKLEFYSDTVSARDLPKNELNNKKKGRKTIKHSAKTDPGDGEEKSPVKIDN